GGVAPRRLGVTARGGAHAVGERGGKGVQVTYAPRRYNGPRGARPEARREDHPHRSGDAPRSLIPRGNGRRRAVRSGLRPPLWPGRACRAWRWAVVCARALQLDPREEGRAAVAATLVARWAR